MSISGVDVSVDVLVDVLIDVLDDGSRSAVDVSVDGARSVVDGSVDDHRVRWVNAYKVYVLACIRMVGATQIVCWRKRS